VTVGVAAMLKQGVTAIVDHFRQTSMSRDAIDTARAAYESTGVRRSSPWMLRDRVGDDGRLIGAPTGGKPFSLSEVHDLWTEIAKRHNVKSRVAMALAASGPTRCPEGMLEAAVHISRRYSLYLHTHVAETQFGADVAREMYGCPMVRYLDDLGFLGPRTSLAHCVWIDDEELGLIANSGAVVAHNPISNTALGSGIAQVNAMIGAKAHAALGTDGAPSNGSQNIWESVKNAALLARCGTSEPSDWLTAFQALMLVVNGGENFLACDPRLSGDPLLARSMVRVSRSRPTIQPFRYERSRKRSP
jgi:5-methylthioadenosine/S-adenosylhomocysteine deaminase